MSFTMSQYFLVLLVFLLQIRRISSDRGCFSYLIAAVGNKATICEEEKSQLKHIPTDLTEEVILLNVTGQQVSVLNGTSFRNTPRLKFLNLGSNHISLIHADTFYPVPELKELVLRANRLTFSAQSLPIEAFMNLKNLEKLDLSYNPLGVLHNHIFQSLLNLKVLILERTFLSTIETHAFDGLSHLEVLDLRENSLTTLPEGMKAALDSMYSLRQLYIFNNTWKCDCNLRWLKMWFKTKNITYTVLKESQDSVQVELKPVCHTPPKYNQRPLFSKGQYEMGVVEFECPPTVISKGDTLQVTQGSSVRLECTFLAEPTGDDVVWFKENTRVQEHWPRITFNQTKGKRFKATLYIRDTQPSDKARWTCLLKSSAGEANSTYYLKVIPNSGWEIFSNKTSILYVALASIGVIVVLVAICVAMYCSFGRKRGTMSSNASLLHHQRHQSPGMVYTSAAPSATGTFDPRNAYSANPFSLRRVEEQDVYGRRCYVDPNGIVQLLDYPTMNGAPVDPNSVGAAAGNNVDMLYAVKSPPTLSKMDHACPLHGFTPPLYSNMLPSSQPCLLHGVPQDPAKVDLMTASTSSADIYVTVPGTHPGNGGFFPASNSTSGRMRDEHSSSPTPGAASTGPMLSSSSSTVCYRPCPLHGDMLATMKRQPSSTFPAQQRPLPEEPPSNIPLLDTHMTGTATLPPPPKGILRIKSGPYTDSKTFRRTDHIDDCICPGSYHESATTPRPKVVSVREPPEEQVVSLLPSSTETSEHLPPPSMTLLSGTGSTAGGHKQQDDEGYSTAV